MSTSSSKIHQHLIQICDIDIIRYPKSWFWWWFWWWFFWWWFWWWFFDGHPKFWWSSKKSASKNHHPKNHHQNHHPKNHHQNHDFLDDDFDQNHDFWDDEFDVDFADDSFDDFVDGLQDALPSPYNVKLARYDLLTMSNWRATVSLQCQTGALRSPYNSNWHVTVSLQFKLARYGLLTIQTGALRSPYNSNWRVTVSLQFFKLVYDIFMNGYYPFAFGAPRLRQSLI